MQKFNTAVKRFVRDEDGLTVVEYAVAGGLIAAALVVSFQTLGTNVKTVIDFLGTELGKAGAGAGG